MVRIGGLGLGRMHSRMYDHHLTASNYSGFPPEHEGILPYRTSATIHVCDIFTECLKISSGMLHDQLHNTSVYLSLLYQLTF